MKTTYAIPLVTPVVALAQTLRQFHKRWFSPQLQAAPSVPASWQAFDLNPNDLIHDSDPVDRADEVRREAVDKALLGYLR